MACDGNQVVALGVGLQDSRELGGDVVRGIDRTLAGGARQDRDDSERKETLGSHRYSVQVLVRELSHRSILRAC